MSTYDIFAAMDRADISEVRIAFKGEGDSGWFEEAEFNETGDYTTDGEIRRLAAETAETAMMLTGENWETGMGAAGVVVVEQGDVRVEFEYVYRYEEQVVIGVKGW